MWIKLCLLLVYICLLFVLSRVLETISWCDLGSSGVLSRQLLDPMRLSVAKLKCLLDQRGVSYEGVVEKSELTSLVEVSGPINAEDIEVACEEDASLRETNFTSGAHFIEEVEDAKDSVWLVQVVTHSDQVKLVMNQRWRNIQRKASHFGARIGVLDCSLDQKYCKRKGWKVPILLLALPSLFEKKANVIMYNFSGPATESAVMKWIHDKLDSKVKRLNDLSLLPVESSLQKLQPEIQAILITQALSAPLFFSALSVKFPGRVKFGVVSLNDLKSKKHAMKRVSEKYSMSGLPMCIIYTTERNYTYGFKLGERFTFSSMELFFRFLYPCLNDIFIISFCVANVISWFELFVTNCSLFKRLRKFIWCALKYNLMVIVLWLPLIGIFQMPYLDQVPLLLLKIHRIFTISDLGSILRGDFVFFINNPVYVYFSFAVYLVLVTILCQKYRQVEEDTDDWFSFRQMQSLSHLGANSLFDPMRTSSYDLVGGFEVFRSRFTQHSLWLQPSIPLEYIQHLPTWQYTPQSLASRAAQNAARIKSAIQTAPSQNIEALKDTEFQRESTDPHRRCSCNCHQFLSADPPDNGLLRRDKEHAFNSMQQNHLALSLCHSRHQEETANDQSCSRSRSLCETCASLDHQSLCDKKCEENPSSLGAAGVNLDANHVSSSASMSLQSETLSHSEDLQDKPKPPVERQTQPDILPNGFRKGFMESLQCVICLDEYAPLTMLCGLPCGHVFHETCIISWLNMEKHFCPMCRWPSYKLMTSQTSSA